jgi:hypothetical protein
VPNLALQLGVVVLMIGLFRWESDKDWNLFPLK